MKRGPNPLAELAVVLADVSFVILADLAAFALRYGGHFPAVNFNAYLQLSFFIIVIRITCFYTFSLYNAPRYATYFSIVVNIIKAATMSSIVITFVIYFLNIDRYPRLVAILSWLLTILFVALWRFAARAIWRRLNGEGYLHGNLAVIGTDTFAREAAVFASRDASYSYNFLGFITTGKHVPQSVDDGSILGTINDLSTLLRVYPIDKVIIAEHTIDKKHLTRIIGLLAKHNIIVSSMPHTYDAIISQMVSQERSILFSGHAVHANQSIWYNDLKRFIDIILSLAILTITLPLLLVVAAVIKLTSPGPVFYLQKRTGLHGKRFPMIKFRTMVCGAEKNGRPRWAQTQDCRITPFGRFLRRFRIDELPQLINVLQNDMSLVGPRPERPYFTSKLLRKIPFYAERLKVKPGITGWAQVNYHYAATLAASEEKLLYDIFYVQNYSLTLDLLILLKTVRVVITGRGAR